MVQSVTGVMQEMTAGVQQTTAGVMTAGMRMTRAGGIAMTRAGGIAMTRAGAMTMAGVKIKLGAMILGGALFLKRKRMKRRRDHIPVIEPRRTRRKSLSGVASK
jgi:hypothetical protein